ncbi:MAG: barstar family protein [Gemmataceae bacterium]
MIMHLDGAKLKDTAAVLAAFNSAFGFKAKNRDALVDLLTFLDVADKTQRASVLPGELVLVEITGECPQFGEIAEMAAFVNYRRMEQGDAPVLALAAQP